MTIVCSETHRPFWVYLVVSGCLGVLAACESSVTSNSPCAGDVASDVDNCGQCGAQCPPISNGQPACAGGACGIGACSAPYLDCNRALSDGCEANSARDPEHCGACDTRCAVAANASPLCADSKCTLACNAPFLDCNSKATDGCEINTATDVDNCGSCGNKCQAGPQGQPACANGVCVSTSCAAPFVSCAPSPSNSCGTNTSNDANNCAACGNTCPQVAQGTTACRSGACGIGTCSTTYRDCNNKAADGCEVDTATNPLHCSDCGVRCDLPNAAAACAASACTVASCVGAYKDCNNTPADGCEINSANDAQNCSGCNTKCAAVPNGASGCSAGMCAVGSCTAPFKDCNGAVADGCEVDIKADVNNCGGCGKTCPTPAHAASANCAAGACQFTCLAGFADCDGNAANGCEVNLSADVNHCGTCANVCGLKPNAVATTCAGGSCGNTCGVGFGDCNGDPADGCETNLASDLNNCGSCGKPCSIANGTGTCSSGTCNVLTCANPFQDCDKNAANGCEANASNDPKNCGACGNVCIDRPNTSSTVCIAARCGFTCTAGHADCNSAAVDGCEIDTTTDAKNCGACGNACSSADWCRASKCCPFGVHC